MTTRSRYADNGSRRRKIRARLLAGGRRCAICGLPVDPGVPTPDPLSAEVDEIVPVSRGGDPLDPDNCQLAHRCCNRWRSSKSMRLVAEARRLVAMEGPWRSPTEFVERAKRALGGARGRKARAASQVGAIETSREW